MATAPKRKLQVRLCTFPGETSTSLPSINLTVACHPAVSTKHKAQYILIFWPRHSLEHLSTAAMTKRTKSQSSPASPQNHPKSSPCRSTSILTLPRGRGYGQVRNTLWSFSQEASKEDGNFSTREVCLHFLWQKHRQATISRYLEVRRLQEDRGRRRIHRFVSLREGTIPSKRSRLMLSASTPAAAATRSTIRRLREIAEV
jgi:hypothetical protein